MASAIRPMKTTDPITMPAIAPPLNPESSFSTCELAGFEGGRVFSWVTPDELPDEGFPDDGFDVELPDDGFNVEFPDGGFNVELPDWFPVEFPDGGVWFEPPVVFPLIMFTPLFEAGAGVDGGLLAQAHQSFFDCKDESPTERL